MGITDKSDDELFAVLNSSAGQGMTMITPYLQKLSAGLELERRGLKSLTKSTRRLECVTWVLALLTGILVVLTALLAFRH